MCRFRSGIILKNRIVVAQGANDSHSDMLDELGIEDSCENAMRKFVKAELVPHNGEWWTDPDTWEVIIDQDITPEWFDLNRDKYVDEFKKSVKEWWEGHVFVDQKINELSRGYCRLKRCEVKDLAKDVQVMLDNSTVRAMWDNSTVQEMRNSSTVQRMYSYSTVQRMRDNSTVQTMWNNSTVQAMYDNSTVLAMWNNSTVLAMVGNSTVQTMHGNSIARDYCGEVIRISDESRLQVMRHENVHDSDE